MARKSIIPIFVPHMGCPNACVFCNQKSISGQRQAVDGAFVEAEIESALQKTGQGPRELAFYGGSFTAIAPALRRELLSAAAPFIERSEIAEIRVSTRPDAIDREIISELTAFGVKTVELGCQSMDEEVLALSGRGHSVSDCQKAAALVKRAGLSLILQMMVGLPGSDEKRELKTAKKLIELRPEGARIYPTVVLRDTLLFELYESGGYVPLTLEAAVDTCAKLYTLFTDAGIPVIRLGLNPSAELSGGEAVAGAYHPAFGELVRSRIYLEKARELLKKTGAAGSVSLVVGRGKTSIMAGQRRVNLKTLQSEFGLNSVKIVESDGSGDEIYLQYNGKIGKII